MRYRTTAPKAFALVELIIVLVIIGIIAAIAVPRVANAAARANAAALRASYNAFDRAIALYTEEHSGRSPAHQPDGSVSTDAAAFLARITGLTTDTGAPSPSGPFGPYLRAAPVNPINKMASVRIDGPLAGANLAGWRFDSARRIILPDHLNPEDSIVVLTGKPAADSIGVLGEVFGEID